MTKLAELNIETAQRTHRYARGWHCLGNAADYRDGKPHTLEVFGTRLVARKLAPTISPGKSWEGVMGGMLGVLLLAVAWVAQDGSQSAFPPAMAATSSSSSTSTAPET